jgi:hypothetical protein
MFQEKEDGIGNLNAQQRQKHRQISAGFTIEHLAI